MIPRDTRSSRSCVAVGLVEPVMRRYVAASIRPSRLRWSRTAICRSFNPSATRRVFANGSRYSVTRNPLLIDPEYSPQPEQNRTRSQPRTHASRRLDRPTQRAGEPDRLHAHCMSHHRIAHLISVPTLWPCSLPQVADPLSHRLNTLRTKEIFHDH